jgi:CheY-like chemotaxis protein
VYLPRVREAEDGQEVPDEEPAEGGSETVLVVEDEAAILRLVQEGLGRLGYRVLAAASPDEAVTLGARHDGPVHLLITDLVMPQMNGRQLAERLAAQRPQIKCLYMSGYAANIVAGHGDALDRGASFIAKPFTLTGLAAKVRQALEA